MTQQPLTEHTTGTTTQYGDGKSPNGRTPLSRGHILAAALAYTDQHGLQALSMRKLAAELDVEAMSLYNHIDNKDDILVGIADLVFAEVVIPSSASGSWDERTREVAESARQALAAHEQIVPIILAGSNRGPAYLHMMESGVGALREAGFSADMAHHGWHTLVAHVLGYVLQQTATPMLVSSAVAGRQLASDRTNRSLPLADLPASDFPHIVEIAPYLAQCATDDEFEFGLDVILAGLKRKLSGNTNR
ncbi:MAG TPA: TetR/AcrR family transcriptional regulator [Dehalococcoidia bacterium]|nr:TetR/AcrR family transcriptional regulator [Dehalococcoidia bacterium]